MAGYGRLCLVRHTWHVSACSEQIAQNRTLKQSMSCGLLAETLTTVGDSFYANRTMHFTLGENDPLYQSCFASRETTKRKHTEVSL